MSIEHAIHVSTPRTTSLPAHYRWELLGLLSLAFFFHQGDRAIYGVVLPQIQEELHLSNSQLGLVGTILFWTVALMTPVAGYLGDILRKKWMITGALLFWSSTTVLTGLSQGFWSLAALRSIATGGSESCYAPPAYALLARFHRATRALAMSVHQAAMYLGIMTSGFLGGALAGMWGWRSVFYAYGAAGMLVGGLFLLRLKDDRDDRQPGEPPVTRRWENPLASLSVLFRIPTAVLLTVGFTAIMWVANTYIVWAPTFIHEQFGMSRELAAGYAMFFHHLAAFVGVLIGGPLSDALARRHASARLVIQATAMFLGAPAIVAMGLAPSAWTSLAAMTVFGFFRGLYESNTHASLFEVIAPEHRSAAVGALVMVGFLASAPAPWLLGRLSDQGLPISWLFAGTSIAYLIGSIAVGLAWLFFFNRDHAAQCERAS